jgi:thiosulfate/3-mercaptopyruvate sulfurtransferase
MPRTMTPPPALGPVILAVLAALVGFALGPSRSGAEGPPAPMVQTSDPWSAAQLIQPADLAGLLKGPAAKRPLLFHVGFKSLYDEGAIPNSRYAGPCSKPQGIAALKAAVAKLPLDRAIVVYCGCCPWGDCPNMRPAYRALREMGFKNARAMYITRNLDTDWVSKGYPTAAPRR